MKVKISAIFEGICSICKKETTVFTAGDEDTKKTVTICKTCTDKLCNMKTSEVIEKFGMAEEEAFRPGIKFEKVRL